MSSVLITANIQRRWSRTRLQANLVHPLRAGSAYGATLLVRNQMLGPVQPHRAPERDQAQAVPMYRPGTQGGL